MSKVTEALLTVVFCTRNQGSLAGQSMGLIQYLPLFFSSHWNRPCLSAFGPCLLEQDMVTSIGITRHEFDRLFTPQAKGLLQFQTHPDTRVTYSIQIRGSHGLGLGALDYELSIRDPVVIIRAGHDILPIDFLGPPANGRESILDRAH